MRDSRFDAIQSLKRSLASSEYGSAVEDVGSGERIGEGPWDYRPVRTPAPRSIEISANLDENLILPDNQDYVEMR